MDSTPMVVDQPPEAARVNLTAETDALSITHSEVNKILDLDKTLEEDWMEGVDDTSERPPAQPNLAGMIATSSQPSTAPGLQPEVLATALARGWNALGQPSQQDRDQFLRDFSLRSQGDRAGIHRLFSYPTDIYGIPKKFSFLHQAGLRKKG